MNSFTEHWSPDGRPYYYNAATGESVWEKPVDVMPPQAAPRPPPQAGYGAPYGGPSNDFAAGGPMGHGGYPQQQQQQQQGGPGPGGFGAYGPGPGGMRGQGPPMAYGGGFQGYGGPMPYGGGYTSPYVGPGPPIQKGKVASGPPGSNLFIFHIPNEMTNRDLFTMFAPFGNVISARIMVERDTGRSRGFGFVSYDSPPAAEGAVQAMDGYSVGKKRLKVTLKKEGSGRMDGSEEGMGPGGVMGGMIGMPQQRGGGQQQQLPSPTGAPYLSGGAFAQLTGQQGPGMQGGMGGSPQGYSYPGPPYVASSTSQQQPGGQQQGGGPTGGQQQQQQASKDASPGSSQNGAANGPAGSSNGGGGSGPALVVNGGGGGPAAANGSGAPSSLPTGNNATDSSALPQDQQQQPGPLSITAYADATVPFNGNNVTGIFRG